MKVLIIGSGGREHVLAWKIAQSPLLEKLYAAPGNAGIESVAECVDISGDDLEGLRQFAIDNEIDLTVVGPEAPLVAGVVDFFAEKGLKVFGPSKESSQLEGSKIYSKLKMSEFGVPTAAYQVFSDVNQAKHYAIEAEMPVVVKADGLAAGKGVSMCETAQEAVTAITDMMEEKVFGDAGQQILVEETLVGEELSILALTDGKTILPLASAQDHKRAYDSDRGPNTGGMGAYSPCPQVPDDEIRELVEQTVRPIVDGLAAEGKPYRGVLYAGLMLTENGPYVLEYNCRFGDPEVQAVLPRLKNDILPILLQIAEGNLTISELDWDSRACVTVVLASGGYPGSYDKGNGISGLDAADESKGQVIFHAGTKKEDDRIVTSGGRVLAVSALGSDIKEAQDNAYELMGKVSFKDAFYRKDIGNKALRVHK